MDDVKLLSKKIFGEYNLIGNVKYDQNIGHIFDMKFIDIQPFIHLSNNYL